MVHPVWTDFQWYMMLNTVEQSKITLVSKVQGEAVLPAASHLLLMAAVQLEETMNGSRFPGWVNLEMGQPCGSAGSNGSSNLVPMKYLLILFGGISLVDISWPTNTSFFQRSGNHWGYQRNWQNWEITTILLYSNFIWRVSSVLSLKRVGPRGFPFPILLAPVICKAGPWSLHSVEGQLVQSQCRMCWVTARNLDGIYSNPGPNRKKSWKPGNYDGNSWVKHHLYHSGHSVPSFWDIL